MSDIAETISVLMFLASIGVVSWGFVYWRMETVILGCCLGVASVLLAGIR